MPQIKLFVWRRWFGGLLFFVWLTLALRSSEAALSVGTTTLTVGPNAGGDSVMIGAIPESLPWNATANAPWLHLSSSGTGSANVGFSFDANPGATRTGTLTVAGFTVTVTQAGAGYVSATEASILVTDGLNSPSAVAVDPNGNLFIADTGNNVIKKWTATNGLLSTMPIGGLSAPEGIAIDVAGNLYIADTGNGMVKRWTATNGAIATLIANLTDPASVAVDISRNVYVTDTGNNAIKIWVAANGAVSNIISTQISSPSGVAVDIAGNVYIADRGNSVTHLWSPITKALTTLDNTALNPPWAVAVNGSGNVFIADYANGALKTLNGSRVVQGLSLMTGLTVDVGGTIYIAERGNNAIRAFPRAFLNPSAKSEELAAGSDSLPAIAPTTFVLRNGFAPTSDVPWLTITGTNGGATSFSFSAAGGARTGNIRLFGYNIPITQFGTFLGTTMRIEGPAAGTNSITLVTPLANLAWTATSNVPWLHLSAANQAGIGSTNVSFTFDANPGTTRTGLLTIASLNVTITQAGTNYSAAPSPGVNILGVSDPTGVAVDHAGNVYVTAGNNPIKQWSPTNNNTVNIMASTGFAVDVAVDDVGNLYVINNNSLSNNRHVRKRSAADGSVSSITIPDLRFPSSIAVDRAGNLYVADTQTNTVWKWSVANSNVTVLPVVGMGVPYGVTVDSLGNVYVASGNLNKVHKYSQATGSTVELVIPGLTGLSCMAVDPGGNVFVVSDGLGVSRWSVADGSVTPIIAAASLSSPDDVAVDIQGNVLVTDSGHNAIKHLPRAFLDPKPYVVNDTIGGFSLPPVVPTTANLNAPFVSSDQPWLTVTNSSPGVVSVALPPITIGATRQANLNLLGQNISITEYRPLFGNSSLLVGPAAGSDGIILTLLTSIAWTSTNNAPWLHLSPASLSGTGTTNLFFTYDANPGPTRTGSFTIAGRTLNLTQAGTNYVPAPPPMTPVIPSGLGMTFGVAVDAAGAVYAASYENHIIKKWTPADNSVVTLPIPGLNSPTGLTFGPDGMLYIADFNNNAIKAWTPGSSNTTTLVADGLAGPQGVAVDIAGNVYIADTFNDAIKLWVAASNTIIPLITEGLSSPTAVALDGADNLYIADSGHHAIKKWSPADGQLISLVSTGLNFPSGVTVDGGGTVYFTDRFNHALKKWNPIGGTVSTVVSSGFNSPYHVVLDDARNIYVADAFNYQTKELPHAFVDPTPRTIPSTAGNANLPVVLPATANLTGPFTPTADQPWLSFNSAPNGIVNFAFSANPGPSRSGNLTVLKQSIAITQSGDPIGQFRATAIGNGALQLSFTSNPGGSFTLLTATNVSLPLTNWTVLGAATDLGGGSYQFTTNYTTNGPVRFFRVRSP